MKLNPYSPDELLTKACQCQADADAIDEIIARIKTLQSELSAGFGGVEEQLEIERLEMTVRRLMEAADHIRYVAHNMQGVSQYLKELDMKVDITKAFK